jgi:hypothetical protein
VADGVSGQWREVLTAALFTVSFDMTLDLSTRSSCDIIPMNVDRFDFFIGLELPILPGVDTHYGIDFRTIHHLVSNIEKLTAEELCKLALVRCR